MNITNLFKRTSLALAAAAMAASMTAIPLTSSAESTANDSVNADRSGIVQVEAYYQPTGEKPITIQTGTGFLINENTILTCWHVTDFIDERTTASKEKTEEIKESIEAYYEIETGEEHKFDEDYMGIQIAVLGDVKEPAKVIRESVEGDYAILTIETNLTTKTPLALCDSDAVEQTEQVYALGYPANNTDFQKKLNYAAYTDNDVTITQGNISKTHFVSTDTNLTGVQLLQHSAYLSGGNSGGPLVNEKGHVVGMNNASSNLDNYYYAIEMNQIKDLLKILGIEYTECDCNGEQPSTEPPTSDDNPDPTTSFDTQPPTPPVPETTEPKPEPDPKPTPWVLIGILGAAAVIVIILIIILVVKGGKKPEPVPAAPAPVPPRPPINPSPNPRPISPSPMGGGMDNGAGETSLLNAGAGETSILGGGAAASRVTIIRKKTGTSIPVNAPEFVIGKENSRVNYCVNNNAVSRQHAKISANNGSYFITDMNSSNFTYLNGRKIPANTPQLLHSGDVFKLADEEFEFRG